MAQSGLDRSVCLLSAFGARPRLNWCDAIDPKPTSYFIQLLSAPVH
jgi:hypothetical protein